MRLPLGHLSCLAVALAAALAPAPGEAALEPLELAEAVALMQRLGDLEEYPDANTIVGFDRTQVTYDETGAYEEWNHTFVKILTDEGVDRQGDESFTYHRRYGTVEVVLARVIKSDGTEIVVEDDLITDGTPPAIAAMDIYETDFREKTIVFPGLEVGDAVEYLIHQEYEPLVEDHFVGFYILQYTDPIVEAAVTIEGPADLPLKHVVKDGDVEFTESTDGGRATYSWLASDVAKIEREMGMASPAQFATRVIVSTVQTWEELSRYGWKLSDEKCVAEKSVKDLVAEITEGLTTTEEKIRAIHYWIIENVRYLGIAMDRSMFLEPHFAAYTLEKEYGVCRDKAVLMVTMLEEIGVPAWVVFINPSRVLDPEIPTVFFEHGIVAIKDAGGEYRYIDPTMETSREVDSPYAGDRWVLVATEEGEDIRKTPHVPASANSGHIRESSTLSEDGGLSGSVTISGVGMYEEILRTIAKSAGEEQVRMMAEEIVQGLYPGASMTEFTLTDYHDLYEPTVLAIAYEIDDYVLDADPYRLFRVPAATGSFDILSEILLSRFTGLQERKYPIALGMTLGVQETAEVTLPAGYVVESLPDEVDYERGAISLIMDYEFVPAEEDGELPVVRYNRAFGIDSFQVSPTDYRALKEAGRLASRSARGEVILMREEG
jgi:transglutaminase-like putative cysteine protease